MRPFAILAFLTPLVVLYELGSIRYLVDPRTGVVETIRARRMLSTFFEAFGVVGIFLPGLALLTILFAWQVASRQRWRVTPRVLLGMAVEGAVWTVPLLVASVVVPEMVRSNLSMPGGIPLDAGNGLQSLSPGARLTISIGAGLYEELIFRLILIAATHALLVDVFGLRDTLGKGIAVVGSAVAFALYHDVSLVTRDAPRAAFYFVAGLYFGGLYLLRGFGIVVGAHALYDTMVLLVLRDAASG